MASKENDGVKFEFNQDFQFEILQFIVTDLRYGFKALHLIKEDYFTLIEHATIADALIRHFKKFQKVPGKTMLKEELRNLYRLRDYQSNLLPKDKEKIGKYINKMFMKPVSDPEGIYEGCKMFARFVGFKAEMESIDILDYNSYSASISKLDAANNIGNDLTENRGSYMVMDASSRVVRRQNLEDTFPTPFWQLNKLINGGGTKTGNVCVIIGPAKRSKTGVLINIARILMRMRRSVLIIDTENGEDALSLRFDQSMLNMDRTSVKSGEFDQKLLKIYRKYKRFKSEVLIVRVQAGTTVKGIENIMDKAEKEHNIIFTDLLIDYPDNLASLKGIDDDTVRISNVYLEVKDLAERKKLKSTWCPSHVNRVGDNKQGKKYQATDIAKAIDKIRHADLIMGVNQDDTEKQAKVLRLEIVDQRDGVPEGACYFWEDWEKQRLTEMTKEQVKKYVEVLRENSGEEDTSYLKNKQKNQGSSDV